MTGATRPRLGSASRLPLVLLAASGACATPRTTAPPGPATSGGAIEPPPTSLPAVSSVADGSGPRWAADESLTDTAIGFLAGDATRLYAGGESGVWVTTGAGGPWQRSLAGLCVDALVSAPSDARVAYASAHRCGTGEDPTPYATRDGGESWAPIGARTVVQAVDPRDPGHVWGLAPAGLARWEGKAWRTLRKTLMPGTVTLAPSEPDDVYFTEGAVVGGGVHLVRSKDGGKTWSAAALLGAGSSSIALGPDAVVVGDSDPSALAAIGASCEYLESSDAGDHWTARPGPVARSACHEDTPGPLVAAPGGAVYVGTVDGVATRDVNGEWPRVGSPLEGPINDLLAFPGVLVAATDTGVYRLAIQPCP